MTVLVSVASGKGGVGKSVIVSNLGLLLARADKRVVLADLDVGGANLHILLGLFHPERSLTGFLTRRLERLEDALLDVEMCESLQLLVGTGGSLNTANPAFQTKQRLLRHLRRLDCDVLLMDIGAGSHFHALDFFLAADHHLVASTPEPTATVDVYKFIKLAAIRKVLSVFAARSRIGVELAKRDFNSIQDILELTAETDPEARALAEQTLAAFRPLLILNRTGLAGSRLNTAQLRKVLRDYVGSDLEVLGEIPADSQVVESVRSYLPVVDSAPHCPAAQALENIAERLLERIGAEAVEPPTALTGQGG